MAKRVYSDETKAAVMAAFNSSDLAYIYGLRDKNSDKYFYVGSTKHTPQRRWRQHQEQLECGNHHNGLFVRTVH